MKIKNKMVFSLLLMGLGLNCVTMAAEKMSPEAEMLEMQYIVYRTARLTGEEAGLKVGMCLGAPMGMMVGGAVGAKLTPDNIGAFMLGGLVAGGILGCAAGGAIGSELGDKLGEYLITTYPITVEPREIIDGIKRERGNTKELNKIREDFAIFKKSNVEK